MCRAQDPDTPTTFAFDPSSPLRNLVPEDQVDIVFIRSLTLLPQINRGLSVPSVYDFHDFPPGDVLAPLYLHERKTSKVPETLSGGEKKERDPSLADRWAVKHWSSYFVCHVQGAYEAYAGERVHPASALG